MKNLLILLVLIAITTSVSAQSKWNMSLGTGAVTNISKFNAGDEDANGLFSSNPIQSHNLSLNFRYRICEKLSFQTGLTFAKTGFSYSIAEDYSLLKPFCKKDDINTSSYISSIPFMLVMNTAPNCSNVRFIFGAGASVRGVDNNWESESSGEIKSYEAANITDTYITATSRTKSTVSPALTWMIGMEKLLRKGNSLSFTFQGNQGLSTISESTVNYTVANKDYTHTFINRGSFVALSLAYNFSPFGTKKANNLMKNTIN